MCARAVSGRDSSRVGALGQLCHVAIEGGQHEAAGTYRTGTRRLAVVGQLASADPITLPSMSEGWYPHSTSVLR